MKPCARCGFRHSGPVLIGEDDEIVWCPGYVRPAPWWMRLLDRLIP